MSTDALDAATSSVPTLKEQASAFWRTRAPRERIALGSVLAASAVVVVWLLLVQPAWRTVHEAPVELDRLDRELQQVQSTAVEVRSLRAIAPVSSTQAAAALKAATDRLGERARLTMQGDRATLTLIGVSTDGLAAWLNEARSAARARPIEASLSRAPQGYSGTIGVTLGGVP